MDTTTTRPECSAKECDQPATRQAYAEEQTSNPWDAENFVPLCADHDPRDGSTWPLVMDDDQ